MTPPLSLNGSVALTHLGVMRARGAEAGKFLHAQLTNDMLGIEPSRARLAGFCSAKGRLQASFLTWKQAEDDFLLACSASVLPMVLKRLSMFVLRTQCKLSDASLGLQLRGLVGATAQGLVQGLAAWDKHDAGKAAVIRLPDAGGLVRCVQISSRGADVQDVPAHQPTPDRPITLDAWRWLEVQSGLPTIEAATVDQFVPQMLNYDLVGGVDFRKGCYPGQEIVARSQYRGTIKRRTFLFDCSDDSATAGQELFHSDEPAQPAGMVANGAPHPSGDGSSLLAEVKLAALRAGSLHLGSPTGPELKRAALPYDVPLEPA